jgi:hypothetical protein
MLHPNTIPRIKAALAATPQFKFVERKMAQARSRETEIVREESKPGYVAPAMTLDSRVRDRIECYARKGTVITYERVRNEVIDEMSTQPSEDAITDYLDQWRRLHGASPSAGHYAGIRADASALMKRGFTPEQVRNSGLAFDEAASRARQGRKLPQDPNLIDGSTSYPAAAPSVDTFTQESAYTKRGYSGGSEAGVNFSRSRDGRLSPEVNRRVREKIEHYSRTGQHKAYHEIVSEVEEQMRRR